MAQRLGGDYPEAVDWITNTESNVDRTPSKDLLTRDNIGALKVGMRRDRDSAFIAILYETGACNGELINPMVVDKRAYSYHPCMLQEGRSCSRCWLD